VTSCASLEKVITPTFLAGKGILGDFALKLLQSLTHRLDGRALHAARGIKQQVNRQVTFAGGCLNSRPFRNIALGSHRFSSFVIELTGRSSPQVCNPPATRPALATQMKLGNQVG
jgi:hypothetical protein